MKKILLGSGVVVAVAAAIVAFSLLGTRDDPRGGGAPTAEARGSAEVRAPTERSPSRRRHTPRAVLVESRTGSAEGQAMDREWDTLKPESRVALLRNTFSDSLRRLEDDDADESDIATAEAALSALRSELHQTSRGRAEHELMEARLAAATSPAAEAEKAGEE